MTALAMMACALLPSLLLARAAWLATESWPFAIRALLEIVLTPPELVLFVLLAMAGGAIISRPFRGAFTEGIEPLYSIRTQKWGVYGLVMGIVHLTMLPRMSPFASLWIRWMGGRVGKRLWCVNPVGFSDLAMLSIGDDVAIGSGAVIICHDVKRGRLELRPVTIGDGVTVGTHAVVLAGVTIGAGATVAPNSLVSSGTTIPPGEVWAGVPARALAGQRARLGKEQAA